MANKDWLIERLTDSKKGSPRWVELAAALEEYWDTHFFDGLQELENSRNLFTASSEQLDRIISEHGDFFDVELPIDDSGKRLGIAWRREEIHKKNTDFPITSVLNRNFNGLRATWQHVYAPVTGEYDRLHLYTEHELKLLERNLDDYWFTSRGRLLVDLSDVRKAGMTKDEFLLVAHREIERVRPTHIVYDGEYFILSIDFKYQSLGNGAKRETLNKLGAPYDYRLTASFDIQPADMPWLDDSPLGLTKERSLREPQTTFESDTNTLSFSSQSVELALSGNSIEWGATEVTNCNLMSYDLRYQFDEWGADTVSLDSPIHEVNRTTTRKSAIAAFELGCTWSLDQFVETEAGDVPIQGVEGDSLPPYMQLNTNITRLSIRVKALSCDATSNTTGSHYMMFDLTKHFDEHPADEVQIDEPICAMNIDVSKQPHEVGALTVINDTPELGFDELPADFAPLDTPLWN